MKKGSGEGIGEGICADFKAPIVSLADGRR